MSDVDTAVMADPEVPATEALEALPPETTAEEGEKAETPEAPKPAKTPEQRRIAQLEQQLHRRSVALGRAREQLTLRGDQFNNDAPANDSETLSLKRSEAEQLIRERAEKLAPRIAQEQAERERLSSAAQTLRKSLGAERFTELTDDLAEIFDQDRQMAVLRSSHPAGVLTYLTDPEHSKEADEIAGMSDFNAGRAIARIEARVAAESKPKPSNARAPLEAIRGRGAVQEGLNDDLPIEEWRKRFEQQQRNNRMR